MPSSVQCSWMGQALGCHSTWVSHSRLPTEARALTLLLHRQSSQEGIGGGHVVSIRSQASDEVGIDQIFFAG